MDGNFDNSSFMTVGATLGLIFDPKTRAYIVDPEKARQFWNQSITALGEKLALKAQREKLEAFFMRAEWWKMPQIPSPSEDTGANAVGQSLLANAAEAIKLRYLLPLGIGGIFFASNNRANNGLGELVFE